MVSMYMQDESAVYFASSQTKLCICSSCQHFRVIQCPFAPSVYTGRISVVICNTFSVDGQSTFYCIQKLCRRVLIPILYSTCLHWLFYPTDWSTATLHFVDSAAYHCTLDRILFPFSYNPHLWHVQNVGMATLLRNFLLVCFFS